MEGNLCGLDNCNIHKGKEIEKAIEKTGEQLIYVSPYSPDFSPLENC
jgi:transposase